jgi:hypothetical protein
MPDPDVPARPAPYVGGLDQNTSASLSTTRLPLILSGTQGKGFARGWLRPYFAYLTGRQRSEPGTIPQHKLAGSRTGVLRTDPQLQLGTTPVGITRLHTAKIGGLNGPNYRGMPWESSQAFIPHQNINRRDAGKIAGGPLGPSLRTFDDRVTIPAIYAGNAPKG